jgi:3-oxoacyl-[acyl-carrier protein] reductase
MSVTDKIFSLLGFPKPVQLKRFNEHNPLPKNVLLLSTVNQHSKAINQLLTKLELNIFVNEDERLIDKSIESLVIDATNYHDENSYQTIYKLVHENLKYIRANARIVLIVKSNQESLSIEENTFSQALIGFSKSLAKEVGRKGSTVNIISINKEQLTENPNALLGPLSFLISTKSTFVSGQLFSINNNNTEIKPEVNKQKVAVVTGAAQGIGAAIAQKLSSEGYQVIGIDIEPMKAVLTTSMTKIQGKAFILDVSDIKAGEQLVQLAKEYNGFDLIVHNAGITRDKTLGKMPELWWQQTLNINLLSVMRINKELLNDKSINSGGRIVCLSSMNGIAGQGGQTNYACSKAGIIGYVSSSSTELSTRNITINAVAPGFIETEMTNKMPFMPREMGRRMSALNQGGLPIDVAEVVAFFANDNAYAISGQTIRVCGLNIIGA